MKLPCLLITDALAFHTLREYSNRGRFGQRGFHPRSPKARDRGHPQRGLEISPGPGPPADEFFGIANGLKPDRFGWLTPVKVNATEPVGA